ncbi:hypothetical protein ACFL6I_14100 [candidate division KSB1 bacterium]
METQENEIKRINSFSAPYFIDKKELKKEQINDPDFRLKFLEKLYGTEYPISCSKCHHCR